uniref:DUF2828 family protein n=1 Tax=Megaviridae environmental sample TaxID=1737588 RepID=A0A5J6VLH0_9VIRU|nr:MAG: protein of unknown function DUF2828 [Megaviridae environmental sample]
MAKVVSALCSTDMDLGENGQAQYKWNHKDIQELLVQLYFQSVRTDDKEDLKKQLKQLLTLIFTDIRANKYYYYLVLKFILQTRDIKEGKGEYSLSWSYIEVLDQFANSEQHNLFIKEDIKIMLYSFVHNLCSKKNTHPYGSWKDLKYLWSNYQLSNEIKTYIIKFINIQISHDDTQYEEGKTISLAAKWAPRQKSQFKEMFKVLAKDYYHYLFEYAVSDAQQQLATRKAYTMYRKLLAKLNRHLDTTQIKQCENNYSGINFDNVTSITLFKQQKAISNVTREGNQRSECVDRIECANNYITWLHNKIETNQHIKGSNVGLEAMIKKAMEISIFKDKDKETPFYNMYSCYTQSSMNNFFSEEEILSLEMQWKSKGLDIKQLSNIIPMIDLSGSMLDDNVVPYSVAIGLGIRCAERSKLGKYALTFSQTPSWIELSEDDNLIENVRRITNSPGAGYNTNFSAALRKILDACIVKNLTAEEVSNLTLLILSDMQIDEYGNESLTDSMWDKIEKDYYNAGMQCGGVPWKPPLIAFFNLRKTGGFPCLTEQKGAVMLSGFDDKLLNVFCEEGIEGLRTITPYNQLISTLENDRYNIFNELSIR